MAVAKKSVAKKVVKVSSEVSRARVGRRAGAREFDHLFFPLQRDNEDGVVRMRILRSLARPQFRTRPICS